MVHGTALLVRYVLALRRPIDKYDHLMDIIKSCRHDLKLIENEKKIVVFDGQWLDERFNDLPGAKNIYKAIESMQYGKSQTEFDSSRGSFTPLKWSNQMMSGDVQGWYDTYFYSSHKFNMPDLASFDEGAWIKFETDAKKQTEEDPYCNVMYAHTYKDYRDLAQLAYIHKDSEYLAKVQEREAAVTTVPLIEAEQSVLDCVKRAPQLQDIIEHEGFEMYTERY